MPVRMFLQREVRRVPLGYEHPRDDDGNFIRQHTELFDKVMQEWVDEWDQWKRGEHPAQQYRWREDGEEDGDVYKAGDLIYPPGTPFVECEEPPDPTSYRTRPWPEGVQMGIQMYETISEGTPISKVYPDTEDGRLAMAKELASRNRGIGKGWTVDDWLKIINQEVTLLDVHTGKLV